MKKKKRVRIATGRRALLTDEQRLELQAVHRLANELVAESQAISDGHISAAIRDNIERNRTIKAKAYAS